MKEIRNTDYLVCEQDEGKLLDLIMRLRYLSTESGEPQFDYKVWMNANKHIEIMYFVNKKKLVYDDIDDMPLLTFKDDLEVFVLIDQLLPKQVRV